MPEKSIIMKDTDDIIAFGWVGILLSLLYIIATHT